MELKPRPTLEEVQARPGVREVELIGMMSELAKRRDNYWLLQSLIACYTPVHAVEAAYAEGFKKGIQSAIDMIQKHLSEDDGA